MNNQINKEEISDNQENNKTTIFLDIDDVIFNSSEIVVSILNQRYSLNKTINDLRDWGYRSIYPKMTIKMIEDIYESKDFWDKIEIKNEFLIHICQNKELWEQYNWAFVTQGNWNNLGKKNNFLYQHPIFKDYYNNVYFFGLGINEPKSNINMINGIQIDDNFNNLKGTNANLKILLKNNRDTNYNTHEIKKDLYNREDLYIINTFKELREILLFNLEEKIF